MNTRDALRAAIARLESHQIEEARLDAELLMAEARGISRAGLLAHSDEPLDESTSRQFDDFIARRLRHEPVAYILGHKAFYGLDLLVDRRVLIPRPETELLVECALAEVGRRTPEPGVRTIVDVGTGSGAVALALARARGGSCTAGEGAVLYATDISAGALEVARANAARHGVLERIQFVQSDLLASVDVRADLIVANLPYVARDAWERLAPDIAEYEPALALDGGADGLDLFRRFFTQAPARLAPQGALLLEIGAGQAEAVSALARAQFPEARITLTKDLAGFDRVLTVGSDTK